MQILTRRPNEGLVINNKVEVTVLEVEPDRVQLGINDPDSTPTYRIETIYLGEEEMAQEEASEFELAVSAY